MRPVDFKQAVTIFFNALWLRWSWCFNALVLLNHGVPLFLKKGKSLQRCYKPKIHNFSVQPIRVLLIYFTVLFLGFQIFNFSDFRAVAVFYFLDRAVVDVMVAAPSHNSLPFTPAQQQPEWIELSKCTDDEHWNHPVRHFQTSILQSRNHHVCTESLLC